jgi:hypothetical protein
MGQSLSQLLWNAATLRMDRRLTRCRMPVYAAPRMKPLHFTLAKEQYRSMSGVVRNSVGGKGVSDAVLHDLNTVIDLSACGALVDIMPLNQCRPTASLTSSV